MYHKVYPESPTMWWVDVDSFYRQMCELKCRKVVYLDDYNPADSDQAVITFDGVYRNILIYAAPILRHFGYPFELFVTSDYVGKDNSFDTPEPKADFTSTEDLKELVACGGRLQWHSRTHRNLKDVGDETIIKTELDVPEELRVLDKSGFGWFAYPHGDFNGFLVEKTKESFKGGISCVQGNDSDMFMLNRMTVTNETSFRKGAVTVIVASYNYGSFLIEAIESVLRQTRPVDDILIADDCSTDNTMEIGLEYQKRYPQIIKYFRNEENLGIVRNFNKAVSMAEGDYICFLGADNRFRSDYIEKTAEILDSDSDIAIAYTDFALFGPRAKIAYSRFVEEWRGPIIEGIYYTIEFPNFDEESKKILLERGNFMHGSSLYRATAFHQVGGYQGQKGVQEDYNLFSRIMKQGWAAKRVPYPVLEYRQHSREQTNAKVESFAEFSYYKGQYKLLGSELAKKEQELTLRDKEVVDLHSWLAEKDDQVAQRDQQLVQRDQHIQNLMNSLSWKITAPLRRVYEFLGLGPVNNGERNVQENKMMHKGVPGSNFFRVIRTYDYRQAIPNIRAYGLRTFLSNAFRELSKSAVGYRGKKKEATSGKLRSSVKKNNDGAFSNRADPFPQGSWDEYIALSERIKEIEGDRSGFAVKKPKELISLKSDYAGTLVQSLRFPETSEPIASIIIPVYNNLKLTLECLMSIEKATRDISYEIIVVDDGSNDGTQETLSGLANLVYLRNRENLGFVRTCNEGASKARGKYLVFLNNDAQVTDGWLRELLKTYEEWNNVGAVGPKMLYPGGVLQEAGALINMDCSTGLIGLNDDPALPRYNYAREVDYCSGVCLVVEAEKFWEVKGFDADFAPSYCEDVDLCLGLRHIGLRIVYNPKAAIYHQLSATSDNFDDGYKLSQVTRNQQKLAEKWQEDIDELSHVRLVSFYLPQYHPIPENDLWWGKGFTEWRNVAAAKPNFVGHYQPRLPADLGYYDLRVANVMDQQAELAKRYGLHGFCYYYYWFGGKRLLEMPLERLLNTNRPEIPFCLCWANENWSRRWDGRAQDILLGQSHSDDDDRAVMLDLIRYMRHPLYIRINGRPLLLVYRVNLFPDIRRTVEIWRDLCRKEGFGEVYLAMVECFEHAYAGDHPSKYGFDAAVEFPPHGTDSPVAVPGEVLNWDFRGSVNDYRELVLKYVKKGVPEHKKFRTVLTSWDNTARRQNDPYIFHYSTPGAYQAWLQFVIRQTRQQNFGDERIVFINAWNEWAEGAYLEPDQRFGHAYLEATRNALNGSLLRQDSAN